MGNKNFFFRINPCEVLAEAIFSDDKEKWFLQFFNDLKNDDLDSATMPITKRIISEAHSFRAKRSIAGKVSAEKRDNKPPKRRTYVKHMLPNDEQEINTDRTSSSSSNNSSTETEALKPIKPLSIAFNEFWRLYPKKVGKGAAEKAWEKISEPSRTVCKIIEALAWQTTSEQWTKENGEYIPHPATYLNQKRWEDEPLLLDLNKAPVQMKKKLPGYCPKCGCGSTQKDNYRECKGCGHKFTEVNNVNSCSQV